MRDGHRWGNRVRGRGWTVGVGEVAEGGELNPNERCPKALVAFREAIPQDSLRANLTVSSLRPSLPQKHRGQAVENFRNCLIAFQLIQSELSAPNKTDAPLSVPAHLLGPVSGRARDERRRRLGGCRVIRWSHSASSCPAGCAERKGEEWNAEAEHGGRRDVWGAGTCNFFNRYSSTDFC